MKTFKVTLAVVLKDDKILLGYKKRGFGQGLFNGFGGKVEGGESFEEAATRELYEEVGLIASAYHKVGVLEYDEFFKGERALLSAYVYSVTEFEGEVTESNEMRPQWFDLNSVPYDKMFPDDKYWLPLVFEGKKFRGFFKFDESFGILDYNIEVLENLI